MKSFIKILVAATLAFTLASLPLAHKVNAQSTPGQTVGWFGTLSTGAVLVVSNAIASPGIGGPSSNVAFNRILIPHGGSIAIWGQVHTVSNIAPMSNIIFGGTVSLDGTNWTSISTNGAGPASFTIQPPSPWTNGGFGTPNNGGWKFATNLTGVGNYRYFTITNITTLSPSSIIVSNVYYRVISNFAAGVYR